MSKAVMPEDQNLPHLNSSHESAEVASDDDRGWLDDLEPEMVSRDSQRKGVDPKDPIVLVETAFLASAATLIWLVNFYFPIGPVMVLFPIPIALIYLRWGNRPAGMTVLTAFLLIGVLMGPMRSLQYLMPYGVMGWTLGALWQRRGRWLVTIPIGTVISNLGTFFKIGLASMLLGEDLWLYFTMQVMGLLEWGVDKLGLLWQPTLLMVQVATVGFLLFKDFIYTILVHIVAWYLCDRLGNSIPDPPKLVQAIFNEA
jgi:uncharacterized protein YybS (DUF2232 family)